MMWRHHRQRMLIAHQIHHSEKTHCFSHGTVAGRCRDGPDDISLRRRGFPRILIDELLKRRGYWRRSICGGRGRWYALHTVFAQHAVFAVLVQHLCLQVVRQDQLQVRRGPAVQQRVRHERRGWHHNLGWWVWMAVRGLWGPHHHRCYLGHRRRCWRWAGVVFQGIRSSLLRRSLKTRQKTRCPGCCLRYQSWGNVLWLISSKDI